MTQAELRRLARVGAEARLAELERERRLIFETFPDLASGNGASAALATTPVDAAAPKRRRRRMSAAGKARIADAARKRWAAWRAQKGAAAEGQATAAKSTTRQRKPTVTSKRQ